MRTLLIFHELPVITEDVMNIKRVSWRDVTFFSRVTSYEIHILMMYKKIPNTCELCTDDVCKYTYIGHDEL